MFNYRTMFLFPNTILAIKIKWTQDHFETDTVSKIFLIL
ncbi:hypothetical protein AtDm6_0231 [Acetobacter tropicalis]|uniref:Uncharacterized protein n=1 Tax=Acetobacter tropicalis TaxID=104102 RepID=A0A094ZWJ9_9PROT|nr:hypothetical protein AtDm6_0231 [Acetobacter tropicalis]